MTALRAALLASLGLLGGCAARGGTAPAAGAPVDDPYAACAAADSAAAGDSLRCLREVEARLLVQAGGRARRVGSRLELRLAGPGTAEFADREEEGDEFVRYRYGGWHARIAHHVVLADF